jgi:predicted Holliday junction resolvase-like endonuclease
MSIKHVGFKGRPLRSSDLNRMRPIVVPVATENEAEEAQTFTLAQIEADLVNLVKEFLAPFFQLFDFTTFDDRVYGSIIDDFVRRAAARR